MSKPEKIHSVKSSLGHIGVTKPATVSGFSFIKTYGDAMGTQKYIDYRPAKLNCNTKKWFVYFWFKNPETGNYTRFKVYEGINYIADLHEKKEFASVLIKAVNIALASGFNPYEKPDLKVAARKWTFIEGLNFFKTKLPDMNLRPKTLDDYGSFVKLFTKEFKPVHQKEIDEVTKVDCVNILQQIKRDREWKNTTYNNAITFGRLLYSFLINYEICEKNPFKGVKTQKETKTKNRPFTAEHFELIKAKGSPDLIQFMMFLYYTGARPSEANKITFEHLQRERGQMIVPASISKNKVDGFVMLPNQFFDLIPKTGTGLIFGKSKNYYTNKFTLLKRKLKLPEDYTLYSIKHLRACHLAEDGASPYAIQQLFRHSSLDITMNYLRGLGLNISREAADKAR